jgi:hypothetical protein
MITLSQQEKIDEFVLEHWGTEEPERKNEIINKLY